MALIKCYECGKEVSDKAGSCPSCGAPFKGQAAVEAASGKKKTSPVAMGCLVIILIGVAVSIIGGMQASRESAEAAEREQARLAALTPEQREAEQRQRQEAAAAAATKKAEDEAILARAVIGAMMLKQRARNPDSFSVHNAIAMSESKAVCIEYRAQNGFGGMNVGQAVVTSDEKLINDNASGFSRAWNRDCAGKSGTDLTRQVQSAVK